MADIFDGLGFVPVDEIQNIFTFHINEVHSDLKKNGIPSNEKDILDYFEFVRAALMKRAKHNLDAYMVNHPTIKKDIREAKSTSTVTDNKKTWEERVKNNRAKGYLNP